MNRLVLRAHRTGFPAHYEISADSAPLARVTARTLRRGGTIAVNDRRYDLTGSDFATRFELRSYAGETVATAQRSGATGWTIHNGGSAYQLSREPATTAMRLLDEGGRQVGEVRRSSWSGRKMEAELLGLDGPTAVFILCLSLATSQRRRRTVAVAH